MAKTIMQRRWEGEEKEKNTATNTRTKYYYAIQSTINLIFKCTKKNRTKPDCILFTHNQVAEAKLNVDALHKSIGYVARI